MSVLHPGDRRTLHVVRTHADHLVVWKPPGMPSELTTDPERTSLLERLRMTEPEARLCHRLDRPTRGFLVVARSKESAAWHAANLAARRWRKFYVARVGDAPALPLGRHRLFLRERTKRVDVVTSGGQPAWLELLAQREGYVLIELLTGRKHQVRVMLAALGAPLVGDELYGARNGSFFLEHALLAFPTPEGTCVCVDPDVPAFGATLAERAEALDSEGPAGEAPRG
jgi:23S rRNA-/tRNA-specific pseudouridylate synthase